jgi:hypothetical protein
MSNIIIPVRVRSFKLGLIPCVILAFLTSCITQQRCFERFPPVSSVHDSIIYRERTVYRDTIITIKIPADTVRITQDIDSLIRPLVAENKYAKAIAEVYKNKLRLTLVQKDSEITVKLDSARKQTEYWQERWRTDRQVVTVQVRHRTFIDKIFTPIGLLVVLVIMVYVVIKALKI